MASNDKTKSGAPISSAEVAKAEKELKAVQKKAKEVEASTNSMLKEQEDISKNIARLKKEQDEELGKHADISGAVEKTNGNLEENRHRIQDQHLEISQLETKKHDAEEELASLQHKITDGKKVHTDEIEVILAKIRIHQKDLLALEKELEASREKLNGLVREGTEWIARVADCKAKLAGLDNRIEERQEVIRDLSHEEETLVKSIERNRGILTLIQADVKKESEALAEIRTSVANLKTELGSAQTKLEEVTRETGDRMKIADAAEERLKNRVAQFNRSVDKAKVDGLLKEDLKL